MADRPRAPRVPPLADGELTDEQRELLEPLGARGGSHVFRTLVRHPKLYERWSRFSGYLLRRGSLPPRERELVILRTAWRCRSAYEWGQHVRLGREAGLSDEELRRVAAGPAASGWTDDEAALLRAVDELHDDHCIGDETWAELAARYDESELIEAMLLSGQYSMLAGALNSLGVQAEGPLPALGETEP